MYLILTPKFHQLSGQIKLGSYEAYYEENIAIASEIIIKYPTAKIYKLDSLTEVINVITTHQEVTREQT